MNSKQKEALINILNEIPDALDAYINSACCGEEFEYYEILISEIDVLNVFSNLSEAQEVVKLVKELIPMIDKAVDGIYLPDYPDKVDEINEDIIDRTETIKAKIEKA